jgi:tryptophanyl-tRNA synthetase
VLARPARRTLLHPDGQAGILVNLVMWAFNLFPLPPLDGGRVLVGPAAPRPGATALARIEPYGFFIVMGLVHCRRGQQLLAAPADGRGLLRLNLLILPLMAPALKSSRSMASTPHELPCALPHRHHARPARRTSATTSARSALAVRPAVAPGVRELLLPGRLPRADQVRRAGAHPALHAGDRRLLAGLRARPRTRVLLPPVRHPEIPELTWLLTCVTGKGVLNRAHAYKAQLDKNTAAGVDPDADVTAGLFMYPVLMGADILMFNAHKIPVGRDQVQHIEMARDMAQRFNHLYGEHFVLPEAARSTNRWPLLPGLDGRKMSKSYDNVIPLFAPREQLRKQIFSIVTDSRAPGEPKDTEGSALFQIYQAFASAARDRAVRKAYADGIAWADAKHTLFERIDREIAPCAHATKR